VRRFRFGWVHLLLIMACLVASPRSKGNLRRGGVTSHSACPVPSVQLGIFAGGDRPLEGRYGPVAAWRDFAYVEYDAASALSRSVVAVLLQRIRRHDRVQEEHNTIGA
jgi:hypothetical protein